MHEINRPDRANRRRKGKSDPVDAEAAARAVLSGQATAVPKHREGAVESLRSLTIARNSAVKATTSASNQIKALLVGADQQLREAMKVKSLLQLATRAGGLDPVDGQRAALASLGRRWLHLHQEIIELDTMIRTLVRQTVPMLLSRPGIGIHTAAQLLITAGANPERLAQRGGLRSPVRSEPGPGQQRTNPPTPPQPRR